MYMCTVYSLKGIDNQCLFQDFAQGGKCQVPKFKGGVTYTCIHVVMYMNIHVYVIQLSTL